MTYMTCRYKPGPPPVTNEYDTSLGQAAFDLAKRWHTCDVMGIGGEPPGVDLLIAVVSAYCSALNVAVADDLQCGCKSHVINSASTVVGGCFQRILQPTDQRCEHFDAFTCRHCPAGKAPEGASAADIAGWSSEQVRLLPSLSCP